METDKTETGNEIRTDDDLRKHYGEPSQRVKTKKGRLLRGEVVELIEAAPFFCLATSGSDGSCDASPRGGPSGFIQVVDENTLAFCDLSGNRLVDSFSNIIENPQVAMLIMTPGHDETIRVDGRAVITTDQAWTSRWDDIVRGVSTAVVISVENVFIHCAKAFRRSGLWQPETWEAYSAAPDATVLFNTVTGSAGDTGEMREMLEQDYSETLQQERLE